ncbi:unnamed protein product [Lupinus luteus]|uniref:Fe2OG dioxygenase domain-containing protein n=1 Tax=Lupinus luteus TaxID=3873 RepID=A0AAV1VR73_LUPLU
MSYKGPVELHVLDFTKEDLKPGTNSWLSACKSVRHAFEEHGCFVVVYDKASSFDLQNGVFGSLKDLFDLPTETKMKNIYEGSTSYLLRVLAHKAPEDSMPQLGFVSHTDKSFTTILHQNHVNALMVETKDGNWIDVDFSSPASFVVMAGDALMVWSNDRIKSPIHKVVMNGNETRYSLGLFAFYKGILEVPEELIDDEHPLQYKPFDHLALLNFTYSAHIKAYCGV